MSNYLKILLLSFTLLLFGCGAQKSDTPNPQTLKIDDILKIEDPTTAIIELDEHLNNKSNYGELMSDLSAPEKVVLLIENLEREINNGGFNQFYYNQSGNFAHETYEALKIIGADQTALIIRKANGAWPDSKVLVNQNDRQNLLSKIESKSERIWNECDAMFYEYKDDLSELLFEYVKLNKEAFN